MGGSPGESPRHSSTLTLLHLHHSSFFKPSVASPTSQLILQSFHCFNYVTGTSPTSPGEPPMLFCYSTGTICDNGFIERSARLS